MDDPVPAGRGPIVLRYNLSYGMGFGRRRTLYPKAGFTVLPLDVLEVRCICENKVITCDDMETGVFVEKYPTFLLDPELTKCLAFSESSPVRNHTTKRASSCCQLWSVDAGVTTRNGQVSSEFWLCSSSIHYNKSQGRHLATSRNSRY